MKCKSFIRELVFGKNTSRLYEDAYEAIHVSNIPDCFATRAMT